MHLEVLNCRVRARSIRFAGAVAAANARKPIELDVRRDRLVGPALERQLQGGIGLGVDGAVAHDGLEGVIRVGLGELVECID